MFGYIAVIVYLAWGLAATLMLIGVLSRRDRWGIAGGIVALLATCGVFFL